MPAPDFNGDEAGQAATRESARFARQKRERHDERIIVSFKLSGLVVVTSSALMPERPFAILVGGHGDSDVVVMHDLLAVAAARLVIIVILHPHHGNAELHPCKHDPVRDPQDHDCEQPLFGMRDQMPEIGDVEP
jgi:hypothetical protein